MIHRAEGLNEALEHAACGFGEEFRPEREFADCLENGWYMERYVDSFGVEHIRIARIPDAAEECWEVQSYQDGEAPLELLLDPELSGEEKG